VDLASLPGTTPAVAGSKLAGVQQVWAAGSKHEAALALAQLMTGVRGVVLEPAVVAGSVWCDACNAACAPTHHGTRRLAFTAPCTAAGPALQHLSSAAAGRPAAAAHDTPAHRRRGSLFARASLVGDSYRAGAPSPMPGGSGSATSAARARATSNASNAGGGTAAMSPRLAPGAAPASALTAVEAAREQQLAEACELLLLQRWFRELLLEEFVTTLHLVCVCVYVRARWHGWGVLRGGCCLRGSSGARCW
jgi:hypothetical protein